ncbi:bacterial regulatory s, gntR family protein, partial [Vibrio parahaemolyticus V-223/04]
SLMFFVSTAFDIWKTDLWCM